MTETTVTTATPVTLKRAAARLHAARDRVESLSNTWSALLDMLRDQYADLLHQIDEAKIDAREAEDALRAAALAQYEATGKKTLGHGVGVRVQKRLVYDKDAALRWAYANRKALALDTKAFEQIAKGEDLDFVEVVEEATVTLPRDAVKLLGERG